MSLSAYRKEVGFRIFRKSVVFWNPYVRNRIPFLYTEEKNAGAETRDIWNCSAVFWSVRPFMTGIQPAFRKGIIIVKQIQTLRFCIWKMITWGMHACQREQTPVYFRKFFRETSGILWKYPERKRGSISDEPLDTSRRSIEDSKKWWWIPKIFTPWKNQSKTGDSFTVYGIQSQ